MPKLTNKTGRDQRVTGLGLIKVGESVEATVEQLMYLDNPSCKMEGWIVTEGPQKAKVKKAKEG